MTDVTETPASGAVHPPHGRRRWPWVAGAVLVVVVAAGLVWFQPWKVFVDERVDEAVPTVPTTEPTGGDSDEPADPTAADEPPTPTEPTVLRRGELVSLDHTTSGEAQVLELADGSRFLRLEDLDTSNGPDLFVYLTTNPADGDEGAFDDDFVNLGRLEGNLGSQNYEVPSEVDLDQYTTVVIWCDRFNSAFGAADLRA